MPTLEQPVAEQQSEVEVNEVEVLKQELAETKKSLEAVVAKKEELLKETRQAKEEKKRKSEEAEKIQLESAQKNGEFEKLWKNAEEEKEKYKNALSNYQKELKDQAINVKAEKIALELSNKDPDKAELLKYFVVNSLSKLADDKGNVDDDVMSSIRHQFETDKKYSLLLGGNQSAGGSAPGNTRSASISTSITRAEFDKMSFDKQHAFIDKVKKGQAQLTDN